MLNLSKMVIKTFPHGYIGGIVYGKRRIGKTVYSLLVATEVNREYYGCTTDEAFRVSLKNLAFSIEDLIKILRSKKNGDPKIPVVIWDDAGTYASGLMYHFKQSEFAELKAILDMVGTICNCLILTTPGLYGIIKFMRSYDDYHIKLTKADPGNGRLANIYHQATMPSGRPIIRKYAQDRFGCMLEDKWYKPYMKRRQAAERDLLNALDKRIADGNAKRLKEKVDGN